MSMNTYGALSPRTAAFVVKDLLERGMPYFVFEKFGQAKPLKKNSTKTMKFRRYYLDQGTFTDSDYTTTDDDGNTVYLYTPNEYFHTDANSFFDPTAKELTEGVTPSASSLAYQDYEATLQQYGDRTTITDVVQDTHEDDILAEAIDILGEQAAIILEKARFNVLKAGANVFYSGTASARSGVEDVFTAAIQRKVTRSLKRQLAKPLTKMVKSSAAYGTESIAPSFVGVCHPDLEYDLSQASGFVPVEKYGPTKPFENEIGKINDVRYIATTIVEPWRGDGSGTTTGKLSTSGSCDVYPIIYLARDAYGLIPLKGKNSITPMVVNPTPSDSDPMAQRGHVSWKAMQTTIILNDAWMARAEVAVTDDDSLTG